jgi:hypothetical protein
VAEGSLRRLGGGRWQTRDGRFTIEPQSGTWVIVDGEQVDDLGLPLVRGPFRSLQDARAAIDEARQAGPTASPLDALVAEARKRGDGGRDGPQEHQPKKAPEQRQSPARSARSTAATPRPAPKPPPEPKPPPGPAWIGRLDAAGQRRARQLLRTLEKAGIDDPGTVARAELLNKQPALARLAIERRVRAAIEGADDAGALAQAIVDILVEGRDRELDASWRLVDGTDRPIRSLDVNS